MISRSTFLHLRIPFSLFLLPFFLFAASQAEAIHITNLVLAFIIIHFLFYPSSNGFNSYYDKDEDSIGGLKKPPPVKKELLIVSLLLFAFSLILGLFINTAFAAMVLVLGLASKAYSHPSIRLKKLPITGLIVVALFQGSYTYMMSFLAISDCSLEGLMTERNLWAGTLCSLMLFGSYPMTQIYQHSEDARRGDMTFSRLLGITGTFSWTAAVFGLCMIGFAYFFNRYYGLLTTALFIVAMLPVMTYFFKWFYLTAMKGKPVTYEFAMRLNLLSSMGFIIFFASLILYRAC
ncbi:UbiA family prenyltransferase [Cytophagaceae bacterium ABcell3]|nr:UbiA family prenyltransferase [Cytophagaceae bacterium ABcell3]